MRVDDVRQLARWLEEAGLAELELEGPDLRLRLVLDGGATRAAAAPTLAIAAADLPDAVIGRVVSAPVAGVLRLRHPHAAASLAELGDMVAPGAVIGLLQIGLIFAPVVAPVGGMLVRILALPDDLVGFGAPLFEIVADAASEA